MPASKPSAEPELRLTRAPADRLLLGCILALSLAYAGWLVALQVWPGAPDPDVEQGYLGFVAGGSQPAVGGGERSPAPAGEYAVSRYGTSYYQGGGAPPRPIAEGARQVLIEAEPEQPEPSRPREPAARPSASPKPAATPGPKPAPVEPNSEAELGRLNLGPRLLGWAGQRLEGLGPRPPAAAPPPAGAGPS